MPLSSDQYIGDDSTTTFPVTFEFIKRAHVVVTLDGVVKADPADFSFVSDTSIVFVTAPAQDVTVLFDRVTPPVIRLVTFTSGAQISQADLNVSFLQVFFLLQERIDSDTEKLGRTPDGLQWDGEILKITNVVAGTDPLDVVNKSQLDSVDSKADADRAEAARDAAEAFVDSLNAPVQHLDKKLGDGIWTDFILTDIPLALPNMILIAGGVIQESGVDYTVLGNVLSLTSTSVDGVLYQAWYGQTIQLTKLQEATVTKSQLTFNPIEDIGNMPTMQQGTFAARPAFGNPNAIYLTTDAPLRIFRDTGSAWAEYAVLPSDNVTFSNDGIGSGLDADLVRGLAAEFSNDLSTPGFQKLPGGLILQWGKNTVSPNSDLVVTLPIAYPTTHLLAIASMPTITEVSGSFATTGFSTGATELSLTQLRISNVDGLSVDVRWLSLGC